MQRREQEELEKTRWMEQQMVQVPKQSFPRMVGEKQMEEAVAVPRQMDHYSWLVVAAVVLAEERRDSRVQLHRPELREQQRRQGRRQVVPKHQRVRQVQGQRPIDCFGPEQEPMPIGRFHPLGRQVQELEGEYFD